MAWQTRQPPLIGGYLDDAQLPELERNIEDLVELPYDDGKGYVTIGIGTKIEGNNRSRYMRFKVVGMLVVSTLFCNASCALAEDRTAVCGELRKLLDTNSDEQLDRYRLVSTAPLGGTAGDEQYFNIDIDGDDISDYIVGGCSPSNMPADPCALLVKSTSDGEFEFEFDRGDYFSLLRFSSQVYVLVNRGSPTAKAGNRSFLRIGSTGIEVVCANI